MAAGFGRAVRQRLKQAGWVKVRDGGKGSHEIWGGPCKTSREVSVPVKIKSRHTANAILKAAGLGKGLYPAGTIAYIVLIWPVQRISGS